MIYEHPFQDHLDIMTLYIGKPEFEEATIRVSVRDLRILKGYKHYQQNVRYKRCTLVYQQVVFSIRTIGEYSTLERKGFKAQYRLIDGPFVATMQELFQFHLEGVSEELNAYIDWTIIASDLHIEDSVLTTD